MQEHLAIAVAVTNLSRLRGVKSTVAFKFWEYEAESEPVDCEAVGNEFNATYNFVTTIDDITIDEEFINQLESTPIVFSFFEFIEVEKKKVEKPGAAKTAVAGKQPLSKGVGPPFPAAGQPEQPAATLQIGDLTRRLVGTVEVSLAQFVEKAGFSNIETGKIPIKTPPPPPPPPAQTTGKSGAKAASDAKAASAPETDYITSEDPNQPTTFIRVELSAPLCKLVDLRKWNTISITIGGLCGLPRVWEEKAKYNVEPQQQPVTYTASIPLPFTRRDALLLQQTQQVGGKDNETLASTIMSGTVGSTTLGNSSAIPSQVQHCTMLVKNGVFVPAPLSNTSDISNTEAVNSPEKIQSANSESEIIRELSPPLVAVMMPVVPSSTTNQITQIPATNQQQIQENVWNLAEDGVPQPDQIQLQLKRYQQHQAQIHEQKFQNLKNQKIHQLQQKREQGEIIDDEKLLAQQQEITEMQIPAPPPIMKFSLLENSDVTLENLHQSSCEWRRPHVSFPLQSIPSSANGPIIIQSGAVSTLQTQNSGVQIISQPLPLSIPHVLPPVQELSSQRNSIPDVSATQDKEKENKTELDMKVNLAKSIATSLFGWKETQSTTTTSTPQIKSQSGQQQLAEKRKSQAAIVSTFNDQLLVKDDEDNHEAKLHAFEGLSFPIFQPSNTTSPHDVNSLFAPLEPQLPYSLTGAPIPDLHQQKESNTITDTNTDQILNATSATNQQQNKINNVTNTNSNAPSKIGPVVYRRILCPQSVAALRAYVNGQEDPLFKSSNFNVDNSAQPLPLWATGGIGHPSVNVASSLCSLCFICERTGTLPSEAQTNANLINPSTAAGLVQAVGAAGGYRHQFAAYIPLDDLAVPGQTRAAGRYELFDLTSNGKESRVEKTHNAYLNKTQTIGTEGADTNVVVTPQAVGKQATGTAAQQKGAVAAGGAKNVVDAQKKSTTGTTGKGGAQAVVVDSTDYFDDGTNGDAAVERSMAYAVIGITLERPLFSIEQQPVLPTPPAVSLLQQLFGSTASQWGSSTSDSKYQSSFGSGLKNLSKPSDLYTSFYQPFPQTKVTGSTQQTDIQIPSSALAAAKLAFRFDESDILSASAQPLVPLHVIPPSHITESSLIDSSACDVASVPYGLLPERLKSDISLDQSFDSAISTFAAAFLEPQSIPPRPHSSYGFSSNLVSSRSSNQVSSSSSGAGQGVESGLDQTQTTIDKERDIQIGNSFDGQTTIRSSFSGQSNDGGLLGQVSGGQEIAAEAKQKIKIILLANGQMHTLKKDLEAAFLLQSREQSAKVEGKLQSGAKSIGQQSKNSQNEERGVAAAELHARLLERMIAHLTYDVFKEGIDKTDKDKPKEQNESKNKQTQPKTTTGQQGSIIEVPDLLPSYYPSSSIPPTPKRLILPQGKRSPLPVYKLQDAHLLSLHDEKQLLMGQELILNDSADEDFNELLARYPDSDELWVIKGSAALQGDDRQRAEECFTRAAKANRFNALALLGIAAVKIANKTTIVDAAPFLDSLIVEVDKNSPFAYAAQGLYYTVQNKIPEAQAAFTEAAQIRKSLQNPKILSRPPSSNNISQEGIQIPQTLQYQQYGLNAQNVQKQLNVQLVPNTNQGLNLPATNFTESGERTRREIGGLGFEPPQYNRFEIPILTGGLNRDKLGHETFCLELGLFFLQRVGSLMLAEIAIKMDLKGTGMATQFPLPQPTYQDNFDSQGTESNDINNRRNSKGGDNRNVSGYEGDGNEDQGQGEEQSVSGESATNDQGQQGKNKRNNADIVIGNGYNELEKDDYGPFKYETLQGLICLACVQAQKKKYDRALELLERARVMNNSSSDVWRWIGHIRYVQGNNEESAIRAFETAVALMESEKERKEDPAVHLRLGELYLARQRYSDAKETLLQSLPMWPTCTALLGIGVASMRTGSYQDAEHALCEAHTNNPHSPEVWGQLALLYATQQRTMEAEEAVKEALRGGLSNTHLLDEIAMQLDFVGCAAIAKKVRTRSQCTNTVQQK